MILCPSCSSVLQSETVTCKTCGYVAQTLDGFTAWAPELAYANSGFKAESFSVLAEKEASSFWFRARNRLIVAAIARHFPDMASFLEVGCGTGYVLSGVAAAYPKARLVGSEIAVTGLEFAATRIPGATLIQMDARFIPYVEEFDVAIAVDVIEHIQEDEKVLSNFFSAVKPGGGIIISVPQHDWLWSKADDYACHVRRYDAADLHAKIKAAGFSVVWSTSFVSLLLPLMLASRWANRKSQAYDPRQEFELSAFTNAVLEKAMDIERSIILAGLSLPLGGSRFVLARKPIIAT